MANSANGRGPAEPPNQNQIETGVSLASQTSVPLVADVHQMSAAYVALLFQLRLPIALVWVGLTAWGFADLGIFINEQKSDLRPVEGVEGALPIAARVSLASLSAVAALVQPESDAQSGGGVPFVPDKAAAVSAAVLVVALLALAAAVRNARLLLCTAVSLLVCMGTSILAMSMDHMAAVTSLEMGAVLSVAFSFYLLGRFRAELLGGHRVTTAVEAVILMVSKSNIVMTASGMTLLVSEIVMLFFRVPKDDYFRFFWSASAPIALAIATSVSFTPLMLLQLPDFFSVVRDCGLSSQGCNFCSQGAAVPSRASASDIRVVPGPATCCAWVQRRVSEILLLAVAVAAPVRFVCSSLSQA